MARPALTVIGLDSATFDVVDPLVEGGDLPHLARLLERGASGVLRSTTHPLTPHAWSTMVTGVNAGRHGIWDFTERDATGYGLRLINGSYRRAPALWDRLAAAGRRAGVVNVPFSWPAPELDGGFAIAGMDASFREQGMTAPASLYAELRERFGPLELDHSYPLRNGRIDLDLVRRAAEQKVQAALWLAERFDPELLFVVFMAADHVQHLGWREWEERGAESAVAGAYRILDEAVGALVEHAGGGDVLVVSDHGAGALDGVVNLNAWLAREGYLTYAGAGERLGGQLFEKAFQLRKRLPKRLRSAVKNRATGLREKVYEQRTGHSVIDWAQTRAFSYGTFGNIIVNVRGRESEGTVEPGEEYERVRERDRRPRDGAARSRGRADRRRRAPARGPLRGAGARQGPRPADRVRRVRLARQGQRQEARGLALGHDRGRARQRARLRGQPPARGPVRARRPVGRAGAAHARRDPGHRPDRRSTCSASRCRRSSRAGSSPRRSTRRSSTRARPPTTTASSRSTRSARRAATARARPDEVEERLRGLGYLE